MRKVSEILGKNIISLYEGKRIGIIENVAFDKKLKKLKSFIVYDEDGEDIERLFVPSSGVKIEGENAVMIKNLEKVIEDTKNLYFKKNPMNANVYNLKGTLLGKVTEILVSDDTKDIHSLILNDGSEVLQTQIVSGDFKTIIIRGPNEELPVLTSPKKKKPDLIEAEKLKPEVKIKAPEIEFIEDSNIINKTLPNIPEHTTNVYDNNSGSTDEKNNQINLKSDSGKTENLNEINLSDTEPADKLPLNLRRCSAYFGFLIGRRVENDVYNARNEKIIKRNTIITNNTLDICKKWGKLIILARNSVR